jgi:glucokinase
MLTYGLDLGGTKTAVHLAAANGRPRELVHFPTTTPAATLDRAIAVINSHRQGRPARIGVACGGPLDTQAGLILSPPNLPGWDHVPVVATLAAACDATVGLLNDANAAALAEGRHGAGRGCRTFLFITLGTGLGAGVVIDGRLHEGVTGDAGEIGHWRVAEDGPVGYGKAGSLEGFCSGGGLARLALLRRETHPAGAPWRERDATAITAATLAEAARAGDPFARDLWHEAGTRLGTALALVVDLLNLERIILGSLYVRAADLLGPPLDAALTREALPAARAACQVVPAELGEAWGAYAALAAAPTEAGKS